MSSDILIEFIEDAREHLSTASVSLLNLERDPQSPDSIHGLLRALHSIKGNSGFLNLNGLYNLLHQAENVMQVVREQSCACPHGLIDLLFQVLDTIEVILNRLEEGKDDQVDWLARLQDDLGRIDQALSDQIPGEGRMDSPSAGQEKPTEKDPRTPVETLAGPASEPIIAETRIPDPVPPVAENLGARISAAADLAEKIGADINEAPRLRELLAPLRADLETNGLTRTLKAADLALTGLEVLVESETRDAFLAMDLVSGLFGNIRDWHALESGPPPSPRIIMVEQKDLSDHGEALLARAREQDSTGAGLVSFDLRQVQALHAAEIEALKAALAEARRAERIGLILDPENQKGLLRVLKLVRLDSRVRFLADEAEADPSA